MATLLTRAGSVGRWPKHASLKSREDNMRRPSSLFPIAFALGAHLVYGRALIAAGVMGLAYATANAQGTAGPPPVISPDVATLVGTVSVTELSASQANRQALQAQKNAQPVEMPKHRRTDGSPMGAPRSETLKALPLTPAPNAGVEGRALRPLQQSVSIIDGFTGIVADHHRHRPGRDF